MRKRRPSQRFAVDPWMRWVVPIAAGALSPAMGGSLLKAGLGDWLYVSEFIGAVLMYLGFRLAVKGRPAEHAVGAG